PAGRLPSALRIDDLTGVDILLHAADNIYTESQDEKFAAPEQMRRMVDAGDIGRKSGQGFYEH
ncbi:3-hydroxybutyryl-CoA dehydrogenase, partial [Streptomyces sp. SID11233]|nr:3-hydroxybutyryl-CoA dehydrogenase [Streptomyces sp. SID11233]